MRRQKYERREPLLIVDARPAIKIWQSSLSVLHPSHNPILDPLNKLHDLNQYPKATDQEPCHPTMPRYSASKSKRPGRTKDIDNHAPVPRVVDLGHAPSGVEYEQCVVNRHAEHGRFEEGAKHFLQQHQRCRKVVFVQFRPICAVG